MIETEWTKVSARRVLAHSRSWTPPSETIASTILNTIGIALVLGLIVVLAALPWNQFIMLSLIALSIAGCVIMFRQYKD